MFAWDTPTTYNFRVPDWRGGKRDNFGKSEPQLAKESEAIYSQAKATTPDPVGKTGASMSSKLAEALNKGMDLALWPFNWTSKTIFTSGGDLGKPFLSPIEKVTSGVGSGLKWGIILVMALVALYIMSMIPRVNK